MNYDIVEEIKISFQDLHKLIPKLAQSKGKNFYRNKSYGNVTAKSQPRTYVVSISERRVSSPSIDWWFLSTTKKCLFATKTFYWWGTFWSKRMGKTYTKLVCCPMSYIRFLYVRWKSGPDTVRGRGRTCKSQGVTWSTYSWRLLWSLRLPIFVRDSSTGTFV